MGRHDMPVTCPDEKILRLEDTAPHVSADRWECKMAARNENRIPDIHLMNRPNYPLCLHPVARVGIAGIQVGVRGRRRRDSIVSSETLLV